MTVAPTPIPQPNLWSDGSPEHDASKLLEVAWTLGLPATPIPVDPIRIAKSLGIDAFEAQMDTDVAGAIVKRAGRDPVILLSAQDSRNRQRFTCAHELGHFVRRANAADADSENYEFVDLRGALAAEGTNPDEIYANQFAANLLMPYERVKDFWGEPPVEMAVRFQVSTDAMTFRLRNLGWLPA